METHNAEGFFLPFTKVSCKGSLSFIIQYNKGRKQPRFLTQVFISILDNVQGEITDGIHFESLTMPVV